jgi:hypothetical protein
VRARALAPSLLLLAAGCIDWQALSALCQPSTAASSCAAGLLFCDGFESGSLSTSVWEIKEKLGTVGPEACGYRGRGAVRLESQQAQSGETVSVNVHHQDQRIASLGTVFVRAHLLVEANTLTTTTKIMLLKQGGGPSGGVKLQVAKDGLLSVSNTLTDQTATSSAPLPFGRWACLELEVKIGNPGQIRAYVDGTMFVDASQRTSANPALAIVGFGVINLDTVAPQAPIRMWVDEVVVGGERVGCHP